MQLESQLDQPHCKSLAQTILSSAQKSILLVNSGIYEKPGQPVRIESTDSLHSTGSDSTEMTFKDQELRRVLKKRKANEKWSSRVRAIAGPGGVEVPLDDGYTWRKYGQKDILGTKHPRVCHAACRGYYRCTQRKSHGCAATKQVQRSDEDPNVFDVTYHGTHTCFQMTKKIHKPQPQEKNVQQYPQHHQDQQPPLGIETELLIKTGGLGSAQDRASSSFSFPSTPISCTQPAGLMFSSPVMPTISESNCLMVPPCPMSSHAGGPNLQASESDLTELIPPAASVTNSPIVDMDFIGEVEDFDLDFPISSYEFLWQGL